MTRYIDANRIKYRHGVAVGKNLGGLRAIALKQDIDDMPPANVIGRSEYEKLCLVNLDLAETNKGLLAEHKELVELRSKIDGAIKEIVANSFNEARTYSERIDGSWCEDIQIVNLKDVLEILKRSIGE